MSGKKIGVSLKPGAEAGAEAWVKKEREPVQSPQVVPMKRLTIDVPAELHRQLKMKAADEGVKMADLVRSWIQTNL